MDSTAARQPADQEERALATHWLRFRTAYHEVDHMGFVYYGVYFHWFTQGRIELLRRLGSRYAEWEKQGLYLPVLRAECDYRAPLGLDEPVWLETRLVECRRTRLGFTYRVWKPLADPAGAGAPESGTRVAGTGDGAGEGDDREEKLLCATGSTWHAFLDQRRRPIDVKKHFPHLWEVLSRVQV